MPETKAMRPILDREHHGARAHMEVFGSDVRKQRDRAWQDAAQAWQENAELRAALTASALALEEAADKLWTFHCNAPNPPGDDLSSIHRREDKEFMAEKSNQMTAAARFARSLLAKKPA